MPRKRSIDPEWLRTHYPRMTTIDTLLDDFERDFGWRPNKQGVYVKANRMGLRKDPVSGRENRAERTIRWSKEPEMERWMLDHDHGQRMDALQAEWRERWGFGISRGQVNLFRASHGTQHRRDHGGGRKPVPVGTERVGKDGYISVKVRDKANVAMSKDNWKLKHVWEYEKAHGKVPEGHVVYFADRDRRNFDPDNLVAVPRSLVGILNSSSMPEWHDAESLRACIAIAQIKRRQTDIMASAPRKCRVCGRTFVPAAPQRGYATPVMTCPTCLAQGHKWKGNRKYGKGECE